MSEIEIAAEALAHVGPAVSIFGSARIHRDSPYYAMAEDISQRLAKAGFAIIAGGGPGIMEAANKGAIEANGTSIGLNIVLPHEQHHNGYQTIALTFEYFNSRKATFFMHSAAYITLPGGFGTLDELFEALTLIQTNKIPKGPIVLMGSEYWAGMIEWVRTKMVETGTIRQEEADLLFLADDPEQVVKHITECCNCLPSSVDYAPTMPT
ncbi:TIGR00730 family Rossman fold protein [Kerstersia gyiorum]|uniref:LOG family protein n=1 Tax=Kerstersia gyiorum TaxID=206506 RepID=UPI001070C24F|nr:TIGR00730 family Rossman fold protein [Kerstersia gyiorum]QBR42285.1 TIGR00730 family Rossman fold protein [Kerstersia gyiorum]